MASGKKGKKTKGKTLALTDFLQDVTGSVPIQPIRKSTNWADEVDDEYVDPKSINISLPTAPKASRDYEDIANQVPKDPPFKAYLSNLPYDVDEEEITAFFRGLRIASMTIPKDDRTGDIPKLKGFGYVEFEDRESLMGALTIPDTTLKNRRIRIEVAANVENDRRRGGRMGNMNERMGSSDMGGDWRSSNRPDPVEDRRGGGGFTRDGMRDGRDRDYGGFKDRDGGFRSDRDSGFSRNREQDDRLGWRDGDRPNRDNDRDRGFRSSNRDSDRKYDDRDEKRGGFRRYDDKDERNGGGAITRGSNNVERDDKDSETSSSEPRQRRKLQLAPRTKPLEQSASVPESVVPSASIFGNAKPVDTTERERQIEEKLLKENERLTDSNKDRREKDRGHEGGDRRNIERGRPPIRRDDGEKESENKQREPSSRDRRDVSGEDRTGNPKSQHKSPDKSKNEKPDKTKEKRDRPEKEMPKFQEPEPPNFSANNKFALLPEDETSD